jgi:hypothetical protein
MTYNLFIDDERNPLDVKWGTWQEQILYRDGNWIVARDWPEVIELIYHIGMPNLISFDHDLGENKNTGYDIAKYLVELATDAPDRYAFSDDFTFLVHSKNPVGAENIRNYLNNYFKHRN